MSFWEELKPPGPLHIYVYPGPPPVTVKDIAPLKGVRHLVFGSMSGMTLTVSGVSFII
jgi:hypothetical protein